MPDSAQEAATGELVPEPSSACTLYLFGQFLLVKGQASSMTLNAQTWTGG